MVFDEEPEERLLPVIPAGTRALGRTVETARFVNAPVLGVGGLVTRLDEGSTSRLQGAWKFLVINGNTEWVSWGYVWHQGGDGSVVRAGSGSNYPIWNEFEFGASGGRTVLGGEWASLVRSAGESAVLLVEVPADWQLGNTVQMRNGGPLWRLQ